jgi:hypothetical protein
VGVRVGVRVRVSSRRTSSTAAPLRALPPVAMAPVGCTLSKEIVPGEGLGLGFGLGSGLGSPSVSYLVRGQGWG